MRRRVKVTSLKVNGKPVTELPDNIIRDMLAQAKLDGVPPEKIAAIERYLKKKA